MGGSTRKHDMPMGGDIVLVEAAIRRPSSVRRADLPEEVRGQLEFHAVDTLDEVFDIALLPADRPVVARKAVMAEMEEAAAAR